MMGEMERSKSIPAPKPVNTMRKGIRLIKCVGWVNWAKRDMPKRLWEGREREMERAVEEDKKGQGLGSKEQDGWCRKG